MTALISVDKALQLIEQHVIAGTPVKTSLVDSHGMILSKDIFAPVDLPGFNQSSMDGYAFKHSQRETLRLVSQLQAGEASLLSINEEETVRIFTGAMVPEHADTVVMQEHVEVDSNHISINKMPAKGANVRMKGAQIKQGDLALRKGTFLNEAALGFLAAMGIESVYVYKKPRVCLIITGDEIKQPGTELQPGQVYDSNSFTIKAALKKHGVEDVAIFHVKDDFEATKEIIAQSIQDYDLVLISGGISVGDYDFVKGALEKNGAEKIFYKVNQKPGKPLWFGKKDECLVFALPGNPASSLSCFYIYVVPAIRAFLGRPDIHLPRNTGIAGEDFTNTHGKTFFLKCTVNEGVVLNAGAQASFVLKSFAESNALAIQPHDCVMIKKGQAMTYIKLND